MRPMSMVAIMISLPHVESCVVISIENPAVLNAAVASNNRFKKGKFSEPQEKTQFKYDKQSNLIGEIKIIYNNCIYALYRRCSIKRI